METVVTGGGVYYCLVQSIVITTMVVVRLCHLVLVKSVDKLNNYFLLDTVECRRWALWQK